MDEQQFYVTGRVHDLIGPLYVNCEDAEARAHILDKTLGDASPGVIAATLDALGTPEELADRYRTEEMLKRAEVARSPACVLRSVLHWGLLSVVGVVVSGAPGNSGHTSRTRSHRLIT